MPLNIKFLDKEIFLEIPSFFSKDYRIDWLCEAEDLIAMNFRGQDLVFGDRDGNNINSAQFRHWLSRLKTALSLPDQQIIFKTQMRPMDPYQWIPTRDYYTIAPIDHMAIDNIQPGAKFVGNLNGGRGSMARLRMTYELGQKFGSDAFLTCHAQAVIDHLNLVNPEHFAKEIEWFKTKQFENDLPGKNFVSSIDSYSVSKNYKILSSQFFIEVVCETDEYQTQRFTDKVAKPLASGKPFLLLHGPGSLRNLRELGFVTFCDFIDESYDDCVIPAQRTHKIIQSLTQLYCDPNRQEIINNMYRWASHNAEIYQKVTTYIGHDGTPCNEFPRNSLKPYY